MIPLRRRPLARLLVFGGLLLAALACGDTSCDCIAPLDQPIDENAKVYDAIQARLTPAAFQFIESNLPTIIDTFMPGGLEFELPAMQEEFCTPGIGWPCFDFDICQNPCTLTAEIIDAQITRLGPNVLALDAHINLDGMIRIRGSVDCDVPIHMHNKPVHADVILPIDPNDHLMFVQVTGLQISIEDNDYDLDCSGLLGWLIELLKGVITGVLQDQIDGQLDSALDGALDDLVCLACDFYTGGCPAGSTCDGTYCMQGGACKVNPLGMVGSMDLGELMADFAPGLEARLDLFVAVGQERDASLDPLVIANGLEVRLIGGVDAARHDCVPAPDPAEIPSGQPPARMPFSDVVPGTSDDYMAGIAVSDAFLDWFMYKAYLSGILCISLGTETTDLLSSSTIALLGMGSLNALTGDRNVPIVMNLRPGHVPSMEVGAGTFTTDPDGNPVIDEPLLYVFVPGMSLDFYVLLDEHWTRIVTITLDITLEMALDLTPDNHLVVLFGEDSIHLDNVVIENHELLAEDPATLANLLPTLISMALPMLTEALAPIEIPPIEGFVLNIQAMQGDLPRSGTQFFEYLGLYADLQMAPPPPEGRRTRARVADVRVPDLELMSLARSGGPMYPEILVEVDTESGQPAEFSYRVDRGAWRPFTRSRVLRVHDPRLLLVGEHVIEVRARTPGDYRSLDPTPEALTVEIRPPGEEHANFRLPPVEWFARPGETNPGAAGGREGETDLRAGGEGCACGTRGAVLPAWLLLVGLALVGRRRKG